ncbi:unnamed protein product [Caenorhabditis nigoni]|uniref:Lin-15A/B-like domain-containing protein n=1 Tax=Caenorhabditis nigoni TaxID=1611254 RepID=A0A2G5TQF9_9PELO|nr:hypothetical protein B9Z55_021087 [Caenorhabditis nigoni]
MDEAIVKEEVIDEDFNKNCEYVEVKQEEIEQKPGNLLEKDIETVPIDFFENNNSNGFREDIKSEPKESVSEFEKVLTEFNALNCRICQKRMPRISLKLIRSEASKFAIAEMFKVEGFMETNPTYVCVSHIQKIINDIDEKVKIPGNPSEHLMRLFIRKNRYLMKTIQSKRQVCQVCHMTKDLPKLFHIGSNCARIALMIGCLLLGTHSAKQAKSYIANKESITCYSHRQESIDMIFEHL